MSKLSWKIALRKGFTTIELTVASAIGGIVILMALYPLVRMSQLDRRVETYRWLEQYREEIIVALKHEDSWQLTKMNNATEFDCLIHNKDCSSKKATRNTNRVTLYSSGSALPLNDSTNAKAGFTYKGEPCNSFSYSGNDDCPFRVVIVWEPLCDTGACISPDIRFYVSFKFEPGASGGRHGAIDMDKYTLKLVRMGSSLTVAGGAGSCALVGGAFYPSPMGSTCVLDNPSSPCSNPGEFVVGFDANNKIICQPLVVSYSCPVDEYFMGVDSAGTPHCGKCP